MNLRPLLDRLPLMVWTSGPDKACNAFNAAWLEFTGRLIEQELGQGWTEGVHPDDRVRYLATYESAFDAHDSFTVDFRMRHRSGEYRWLRSIGTPRHDADGRFAGYFGACVAVAEAGLAHEHASTQEQHLRLLIEQTPIALAVVDRDMRYLAASRRWRADYRLGDQPLVGRSHYEVFPEIPERWKAIHRRCLAGATERCDEDRFERANGRVDWLRWEVTPWRTSAGEVGGIVMITETVTERVEALERVRQSEERFRQMANAIREVFWLADPVSSEVLYVSPAYELVWGRSPQSLLEAPETWFDAILPEDRSRVRQAARERKGSGLYDEEYRIRQPDGGVRWIRDRAFPIRGAGGEVYRIAGIAEDVTERRALEERLRRTQKLEALGQLAGGVAHDFNNLLTIVQSYTLLMREEPGLPPGLSEPLREVAGAAERGASLTRQLLYFSRGQQTQAKTLELNDLVASVSTMLRRVLPASVAVETRLDARPSAISADAGMIEQVLLNLAINARDAMPRGGRLELVTSRTADAVLLCVSDQGDGIPEEDLSRIFEPFYTTKEVGKGSGLGLASVEGIIQQHGGAIAVTSKLDRGTTFRLSFPAVAPLAGSMEPPPPPAVVRGTTILVVEDDAAVRKVASRVLEHAGYHVLAAPDGARALELWQAHSHVAAVLTDLVMPGGLSGVDLAARLRAERPLLPIVFASGYDPGGLSSACPRGEGDVILSKPFTPNTILEAVASALARKPAARASSQRPG